MFEIIYVEMDGCQGFEFIDAVDSFEAKRKFYDLHPGIRVRTLVAQKL